MRPERSLAMQPKRSARRIPISEPTWTSPSRTAERTARSLLSQRFHRVDARRTQRGNQGRDERDRKDDNDYAAERGRVGGRHAEKHALQQTRERRRQQQPERAGESDDDEHLEKELLENLGPRCAQRHAQTDLAPANVHDEAERRIYPEARERHRAQREETEQHRSQPSLLV